MLQKTKPFLKGYIYRIYPNKDQREYLDRVFGCCRKVWNTLLDQVKNEYTAYINNQGLRPYVTSFDFVNRVTVLKNKDEYSYLKEISSMILAQAVMPLGNSFQKLFKKQSGYPRYKSKRERQSFTLLNSGISKNFNIINKKLKIPLLKTCIDVKWSRELPSEPSRVTVTRTASGDYYASFLCEYTPEPTNGQSIIGIDLGIKTLGTMSNGLKIENPKHYIKSQKRLATLQKRLSKKIKGSKNRDKARLKVAQLHQHISNQRQDYLHKVTRQLVNDNQVIVIEDLNVKGMSKNRHLSKHILDSGMGMFRRFLTYKVIESQWCRLLIADRFYPSTQLCSSCGQRPKEKIKLGVERWTCQFCLTVHDRDENASKNLKLLATHHPDLWIDHPGNIILTKNYK